MQGCFRFDVCCRREVVVGSARVYYGVVVGIAARCGSGVMNGMGGDRKRGTCVATCIVMFNH